MCYTQPGWVSKWMVICLWSSRLSSANGLIFGFLCFIAEVVSGKMIPIDDETMWFDGAFGFDFQQTQDSTLYRWELTILKSLPQRLVGWCPESVYLVRDRYSLGTVRMWTEIWGSHCDMQCDAKQNVLGQADLLLVLPWLYVYFQYPFFELLYQIRLSGY